MNIIHNGNSIETDENILLSRWGNNSVFGERKAEKPGYCIFKNTFYALDLIKKHIVSKSKIAMHTDVDVDGVGTTYIVSKFFKYFSITNTVLVINKEKIHGIQQKHVDYFNVNKVDLMVITDSSCNDIDIIKQFNCDVLVIDHHDMVHSDTLGYCNDGVHRYVIVNSTIKNDNQEFDIELLQNCNSKAFINVEQYNGTQAMSCALATYELLRVYCTCFDNEKVMENLRLFQWAGITLFTDVIDTINERNQWYLDNTLFTFDIEPTIKTILSITNKYKKSLDKSYIQYTFAPLINKAIRAGQSGLVVDIIINNPSRIAELFQFSDIQRKLIDKVFNVEVKDENGLVTKGQREFTSEQIIFCTDGMDIPPNYNGVIASRLQGDYSKNALVYCTNDQGICVGSFRGKFKNVNYRKFFEETVSGIFAQGHPGAFGYKATYEQLTKIMNNIKSIEPLEPEKPFFTVGNVEESKRGIYHITDINEFKRQGYIWKIATGNSKVTSQDEIYIRVKVDDVKFKSTTGKLLWYNVFGIDCKAFDRLEGEYFDVYIEFDGEISAYIRKVND